MLRLLLTHLLGVGLLLSPLPGEVQGDGREVIQLCGTELVLYWIRLCGNLNWDRMAPSQEQPGRGSGPPAEMMPSFITKDAETLTLLGFIAASPQELHAAQFKKKPTVEELQDALKDAKPKFKELMESVLNQIHEAEEQSHSELRNIGSAKHSLKKRETLIVDKCCNYGCTKREMARFC